MAQIQYSTGDLHRYHPELPADCATVSSVTERIIQQCLKRFYEKHSSVSHYTGNRTQFISSSTLGNESGEHLVGLIGCEEFKKKLRSSEARQILDSAELSEKEIDFLLKICSSADAKSSAQDTDLSDQESTNLTVLRSLLGKLTRSNFPEQGSEPEQFKDVLVFESKREFEAAVRDGLVDRELHCRQRAAGRPFTGDSFVKLVPKKRPAVHPDHPLNHLADLHLQLFHQKKKLCLQREDDSDKATTGLDYVQSEIPTLSCNREDHSANQCLQSISGSVPQIRNSKFKSLWDVKESDFTTSFHKPNSAEQLEVKEKGIDVRKEFVLLPKNDDLLPIPLIKEHCISLDELLKEFPQYSKGIPSKTLYLKNLHKRVTPQDLVSLFGHFDDGQERATYRLLSGRMRGQAFIKFLSASAATAALETCLGFRLKGKTLVIQYGKHI